MINENLILACKKMQRDAQRQVYELLAPKLYATCKRYLKKEEEIEEALADAFFIRIHQDGSTQRNWRF